MRPRTKGVPACASCLVCSLLAGCFVGLLAGVLWAAHVGQLQGCDPAVLRSSAPCVPDESHLILTPCRGGPGDDKSMELHYLPGTAQSLGRCLCGQQHEARELARYERRMLENYWYRGAHRRAEGGSESMVRMGSRV